MPHACPALLEYALIDLTTKSLFKTVLATYNSFKIKIFSSGLKAMESEIQLSPQPPSSNAHSLRTLRLLVRSIQILIHN